MIRWIVVGDADGGMLASDRRTSALDRGPSRSSITSDKTVLR